MKPVFSGIVADVLPLPNGLIFSYAEEVVGEQARVAFKMLSFHNGRMTNVAKNVYQSTKFGPNYKAFCAQSENYVTDQVLIFPGEQMLMMEQNGNIRLLDTDASILYAGVLWHDGTPATGMARHRDRLWCCFPSKNMLVRYGLSTMREELRIGGGKETPFDGPCHLFVQDDTGYLCNERAGQILQLDLNSYALRVYRELPEGPRRYLRVNEYEFVVTGSGLYML